MNKIISLLVFLVSFNVYSQDINGSYLTNTYGSSIGVQYKPVVNLNVDSYDGNEIKIYAKPRDNDITVGKNTILTIEPSEIKITVESVRV